MEQLRPLWLWMIIPLVMVLCIPANGSSGSSRNSAHYVSKSVSPSSKESAHTSILSALVESQYTDLVELLERAGMLQGLEKLVANGTHFTIFAPRNAFLEKEADPEFKNFLMALGNAKSLKKLLQNHILTERVRASDWGNKSFKALSSDEVRLFSHGKLLKVELSAVAAPDSIIRKDGVVHGINGLLIPRSVQAAYAVSKNGGIVKAMFPEGAPEFDPTVTAEQVDLDLIDLFESDLAPSYFAGAPDLAPAPAPGPSNGHHKFYGWEDVNDFVSALVNYGGYSEMAELLVNLTSFAWDLARLVNEGHKLTLLAPNDQAIDLLTTEQLNAPGGVEALLMYHVIPEYQTEESLYNAVRRFGKVHYSTLKLPHKIMAQESDGTVQFGEGESAALVYDHDIFTDGHLSVQGINKVLSPPELKAATAPASSTKGRGLYESEEDQASEGKGSLTKNVRQWLHI